MTTQSSSRAPEAQQRGIGLDGLDLRILTEMEADGRMPVSDLAKRLGISRAYAQRRFRRLLDRKVTRIMAVTNPLALGYRTFAVTGIKVSPDRLQAVAGRLRSIPNVIHASVTAGWADIAIYTMFTDPADLPQFSTAQLG
ncbi:MAG: AsnC family transcriptional regulator, partial [Chloroflexi bacterium]|nr:AsnC family transcriptional regulator [Chloroflexota bacterium]